MSWNEFDASAEYAARARYIRECHEQAQADADAEWAELELDEATRDRADDVTESESIARDKIIRDAATYAAGDCKRVAR